MSVFRSKKRSLHSALKWATDVLTIPLGKERLFTPESTVSKLTTGKGTVRRSLHELVALGNVDELSKRLVKATNEEMREVDNEGRTLLHVAVENERENVVQLLYSLPSRASGKVPSAHRTSVPTLNVKHSSLQDNRKRTPLYLAVHTGKQMLVELVLKMTDDVDVPGPNDRTPLHLAVLNNKQAIVHLLMTHGANPLNKDKEGTTAIGIAARAGSLIILDVFFSFRPDESGMPAEDLLQSTSGPNDSSLLHLAVESGNVDVVVYLLSRRINKRRRDALGLTAAHIASELGNVSMLRQLIGADPWLSDVATNDGITPVHKAAQYDQVHALKFLLSKGGSALSPTSTGASPLLIAASCGSSNVVSELLHCGVDYMAVDRDGVNVLQHAVGHTRTLCVLVEALKDRRGFETLVSVPDSSGATVLHHAALYGEATDVAVLVKHGSNLGAVDQNGATPLHLAAGRGHLRLVMKISLCAPRLLNEVDGCGRTPLHTACMKGHFKVVVRLLDSGAAVLKDRDGRTPFHYAAWHGSVDCMKALMSAALPELNSVDIQKSSALHLAVAADHPDLVRFLLDHGAAVTDNENGQNCLDVAIAQELQKCALTIVQHERWEKAMQPADKKEGLTQLQRMVEKVPDAALIVMDRCVVTSRDMLNEKREFNFAYMLGVTSAVSQVPAMASSRLLEAMVKFRRTKMLAHPLCVEFLNSKWRKYGAAVVIGNIAVYLCFLLLLMSYVIVFPAYSPDPLNHNVYLQRLMDLLPTAQAEQRTSLNAYERIVFCYGHPELRLALIVVAFLCLVKEFLPLWYQGLQYFKRLPNVCEVIVYAMTLVFLDPYELVFYELDIPNEACPKHVWEVAAMTVFLSWLVLFLNFRRLPHVGIYIMMLMSMVATMLQFLVVASLFVIGFGLAFYMIQSNEASFSTGGLSMMKTFLMAMGDLDYDDVLPTLVPDEHNISGQHALLQLHYPEFSFVTNHLTNASWSNFHTEAMACNNATTCSVVPVSDELQFSSLSYFVFLCFAVLMPIVVLNTLIALAVGDIAAVQEHAALRQIRMQVKLLVELESALPSWFVSHVQVTNSSQLSGEGNTLRNWMHRTMKAAEEPTTDQKNPVALQLAEVKCNLSQLQNWLDSIEDSLDRNLPLLKSLAACVKQQQQEHRLSLAHASQKQPFGRDDVASEHSHVQGPLQKEVLENDDV